MDFQRNKRNDPITIYQFSPLASIYLDFNLIYIRFKHLIPALDLILDSLNTFLSYKSVGENLK